jgi:predicted lactoylglutathione lyase
MNFVNYDLTDIELNKLNEFFEKHGINKDPERSEKLCCYIFRGEDILIRMGADPFKEGLLFDQDQGTRGEGYCSYVAIEALSSVINEFISLVKNHGCTKEGPCFEPQFI